MWRFAWKNLLTRPLRTALALVGLSIPILGVLGLFSLSGGLRNLVGDTLSQIEGLLVVRENTFSPVFSKLPTALEARLEAVPGIRAVAPEIMDTAPSIEGRSTFISSAVGALTGESREQRYQSLFDQPIIQGQNILKHQQLRSAVFPANMVPPEDGGGRFLSASDIGKKRVVISRKIARDYPVTLSDGATRPRQPGDSIRIGDDTFEVVGLYETGSILLDVVIVMDINVAREILNYPDDLVSCYYVELEEPGASQSMGPVIERAIKDPSVNARSMDEINANFAKLMGDLDLFLLMTVSLALVVGVVGIINTMLMSTTERFAEFGVLRTNGWSRANVLTLVTAESASLGLWAGLVGCLLAGGVTLIANQFLTGGLSLALGPRLYALGLGLAVFMGVLGGLYPAWRASRLVPMEAIRAGGR